MVRSVLAGVLVVGLLAGCAGGGNPAANITPQERKALDNKERTMFAALIARHRKYGLHAPLFGWRRTYANPLVSGPALEDGLIGKVRVICAKVFMKTDSAIAVDRQLELSAIITEGPRGVLLTMGDEDILGSRCKGTYVPFPELEALNREAS